MMKKSTNMKSTNIFKLFVVTIILVSMGCTTNQPQGDAANGTSKADHATKDTFHQGLIDQYFPEGKLPLEVRSGGPVPERSILRGKDLETFYPSGADGDIQAIAQFNFFEGYTTLVYRENWLYNDTYIASFPIGKFSLQQAILVAGVFANDETDGENWSLLEIGPIVHQFQWIDGIDTDEGRFRLTVEGELVAL
jgi:hypothetical protein